jgi:selenide,water dikinase
LEELLIKTGLYGDIDDAAVIPIKGTDSVLVKNLDIFTPIVDEPEIQGEIAACNVTNDLFAMNVLDINGGMLVFLAITTTTPDYISEGILRGIKHFMEKKVDSEVAGGHTIYCDWPLIGGEASGIVHKDTIIRKSGVKKGDKLILTKPIGLQAVMAAYRILKDMPELLDNYSRTELQNSIDIAIKIMTTPNQDVVKTIHSFKDFSFVHAMSDVTGFGLAGHAKEMLQHSSLSGIITKTPSVKLSKELSDELGYAFNECVAHETAGGMLMAIASEKVEEFSNALSSNNISNWIIGEIDDKTPGEIRISKEIENLEISNY